MIRLEIKIKEDTIQDFEKVSATCLNVSIKEKSRKVTKGEVEAMKLYKKKMGFDNNLLVVNKCRNQENFDEVKDEIINENL